MSAYLGATHCSPCDATVAVVEQGPGQPAVLVEYEPDGFTVSPDRHVCWPRHERSGRLVELRRRRAARS